MNDERLDSTLGAFYKGTAKAPPDPEHGLREVITRLPRTRQRSRWWPLPTLGRRSAPDPRDAEYQAVTQPLVADRFPIVTRRTYTMFSPITAITTAALVFALGGLLLVAQPFAQQEEGAPGVQLTAQTDAVAVTATQECDTSASPVACTYTASDPRVAGSGGHVFVEGISGQGHFVVPGSEAAVYWTDFWIEGPEGAWTGHSYLVGDDAGAINALTMLAGDGAYEGWSYITYGSDAEADGDHDLIGVIYEGPLPPVGPVVIPGGD